MGRLPSEVLMLPPEERAFLFQAVSERNRRGSRGPSKEPR